MLRVFKVVGSRHIIDFHVLFYSILSKLYSHGSLRHIAGNLHAFFIYLMSCTNGEQPSPTIGHRFMTELEFELKTYIIEQALSNLVD